VCQSRSVSASSFTASDDQIQTIFNAAAWCLFDYFRRAEGNLHSRWRPDTVGELRVTARIEVGKLVPDEWRTLRGLELITTLENLDLTRCAQITSVGELRNCIVLLELVLKRVTAAGMATVVFFFNRPTGCQRLRLALVSDSSLVAAPPSPFLVHEPAPSPPPSSPITLVAVVT
jgi:hypothetical protein